MPEFLEVMPDKFTIKVATDRWYTQKLYGFCLKPIGCALACQTMRSSAAERVVLSEL